MVDAQIHRVVVYKCFKTETPTIYPGAPRMTPAEFGQYKHQTLPATEVVCANCGEVHRILRRDLYLA